MDTIKNVPWPITLIMIAIIGATTFLVWDGKVDSTVFVALVSAITGGGLLHFGATATATTGAPS